MQCRWALLYIERWLKAPMEREDGTRWRVRVVPLRAMLSAQFSRICLCITRLISGWHGHSLSSHGVGMPTMAWFTCRDEHEAEVVKAALQARLAECRLEMHPTKTRIVYCKRRKAQRQVSEHEV